MTGWECWVHTERPSAYRGKNSWAVLCGWAGPGRGSVFQGPWFFLKHHDVLGQWTPSMDWEDPPRLRVKDPNQKGLFRQEGERMQLPSVRDVEEAKWHQLLSDCGEDSTLLSSLHGSGWVWNVSLREPARREGSPELFMPAAFKEEKNSRKVGMVGEALGCGLLRQPQRENGQPPRVTV